MSEFMPSCLIVKFGLYRSSLLLQSINRNWTKWSRLKVYILEWSSTPQKKRQNVKDNVIQDRGFFNHFAYFFQFSRQRYLTAEATVNHVFQRVKWTDTRLKKYSYQLSDLYPPQNRLLRLLICSSSSWEFIYAPRFSPLWLYQSTQSHPYCSLLTTGLVRGARLSLWCRAFHL